MTNSRLEGIFSSPIDPRKIRRQSREIKKTLIQDLSDRPDVLPLRVAFLGGSTTSFARENLELFLLANSIKPSFYESPYGTYLQAGLSPTDSLIEFSPELLIVFTSSHNIQSYPQPGMSSSEVSILKDETLEPLVSLWDRWGQMDRVTILQNNFDLPAYRSLGFRDALDEHGRSHFVHQLNDSIARAAKTRPSVLVNDIASLSSYIGLKNWHDHQLWYSAKCPMSMDSTVYWAEQTACIIRGFLGRTEKVCVVDLDNTLWGGVIGEQDSAGLILGPESPEGEAFSEWQSYLKNLRSRGVVLAVASKNENSTARMGLRHRNSTLVENDFAEIRANWQSKDVNLREISDALNLDLDSFVFLDDSPAERALVKSQLPQVRVPDLGCDVSEYIQILDRSNFFAPRVLTSEDLARSQYYQDNQHRKNAGAQFSNYEEFLEFLEMEAEFQPFSADSMQRVHQLVQKTNQFNLTNERYSLEQLRDFQNSSKYLCLTARLKDRFGDNGLVSAFIGEISGSEIEIKLWIMSCRVFERRLEHALFAQVLNYAQVHGINQITGNYILSKKNVYVENLYQNLGFQRRSIDEQTWTLNLGQLPEAEIIRHSINILGGLT